MTKDEQDRINQAMEIIKNLRPLFNPLLAAVLEHSRTHPDVEKRIGGVFRNIDGKRWRFRLTMEQYNGPSVGPDINAN